MNRRIFLRHKREISTMPSATKELENIYRDNSMENYFIKCNVKKYGVCEDGWAFAWPLF